MTTLRSIVTLLVVLTCALAIGCQSGAKSAPKADSANVGVPLARSGDEIIVCGQYFHTGTPVVLWTDPGGYDAYRVHRRFVPYERSNWHATTQETKEIQFPNRYNTRAAATTQEAELVRGGGWPLNLLQKKVDQFVIHYDVTGTSQQCFKVLHDQRDLSVHFLLDID